MLDGVVPICVGDCIGIHSFYCLILHSQGVKIDFDNSRIAYYNNDMLVGVIAAPAPLEEGTIFPCVDLSAGSEVLLHNDPEQLLLN